MEFKYKFFPVHVLVLIQYIHFICERETPPKENMPKRYTINILVLYAKRISIKIIQCITLTYYIGITWHVILNYCTALIKNKVK